MSLKPVSAEYLRARVAEVEARKVEEAKKLKDDFFQRIVQKAVDTANHGKTNILIEYIMGTVQEDTKVRLPFFWQHTGHLQITYEEMFQTIQELFPGCKITKGQTPLASTWCLTIDWS